MAYIGDSNSDRRDRRYISSMMEAPILERDHEADLARRWRDGRDERALHELITSHVRLVVRIAARFRGYGLPLPDLVQEGNIGLLEAANRFDVGRQVRFSTYAGWWILASIQEYVIRNASIVRIGTTPAQKSLFFNLRRLRAKFAHAAAGAMTDAERRRIADMLGVPTAAVERMEAHLSGPDRSLNDGVGEGDSEERQDFLVDPYPTPEAIVADRRDGSTRARWLREAMRDLTPRERQVISRRFLDGRRTTLAEIGRSFGVTKERIRQIEAKALVKLRNALTDRADASDMFPG